MQKEKAATSRQQGGSTTVQYLRMFGWSLGAVLATAGMFQEHSPFAPWHIPIMVIALTFAIPLLLTTCINVVLDEREAAQAGKEQ